MSDFTDYKDFDAGCIAGYFVKIKNTTKVKDGKYCDQHINTIEKSFYDSVGDLVSPELRRSCVIELLKRHNVSETFFKAIAYNYFKNKLVEFSPNKTCDGLVNVIGEMHWCDRISLKVNYTTGDHRHWKLQSCIDDLFGAYKVDEITFVNQHNAKIGFRKFGTHLSHFLSILAETGNIFCSDLNLDLAKSFFDIVNLNPQHQHRVYNQSQTDCFKSFFVNKLINTGGSQDQHEEFSESDKCQLFLREHVESVIDIRLFGFNEPSQRVKDCIINENSMGNYIEKFVVIPEILRIIGMTNVDVGTPKNTHINSKKKIIELTLSCLKLY